MSQVLLPETRHDTERYFELSGIRESSKLKHHPFIVFRELDLVKVEICHSIKDLIAEYPDETKVLAQWRGQWSSDFFKFTVGELKKYLKANPKEEYHVI